jgi:hypothetical protein
MIRHSGDRAMPDDPTDARRAFGDIAPRAVLEALPWI